jgi:recombination endonuclease VII
VIKACIDCFRTKEQRETVRKTGRAVVDGVMRQARPAPCPGPRCATHGREAASESKNRAHDAYVVRVYGFQPGDYQRIYQHQGGRCVLCQRSTGASKRLAVDHDHETGLAYGLLCGPCNKDVMGWSRRDPAYFVRCIQYLENPPTRQLHIVAYHEEKRLRGG